MLLCDLPHKYVFRLISHNSRTHMFSTFDTCSFCSVLDFPLHIYKTRKACMFCQFVYQLQHLLSISYSCSTYVSLMPLNIFWTLEAIQLLTLYSFDLHEPGNYFHGTFDSVTSLRSLGSAYTCIQLEIPGLRQKAGTVHKLKPLSRNPFISGTTRPNLCVG